MRSPTATTSIGTPCASSTSAAATSSAAARLSPRPAAVAVEQPGAQLALLSAGELGDLARVAGPLLHQGQGLQNRVVEVGGQLGALLGADALRAFAGEVRPSRKRNGARISASAGSATTMAEDDVARMTEDAIRGKERRAAPSTSAMPKPPL